MKRPMCVGARKDGSPCNTVAKPGSAFCHHCEPEAVETPSEIEVEGNDVELGGDFLEQMQQLAELSPSMLLDALNADKQAWVTCKKCATRNAVTVADYGARVAAAKFVTEYSGYNKPKEILEDEIERLLAAGDTWIENASPDDLDDVERKLLRYARERGEVVEPLSELSRSTPA